MKGLPTIHLNGTGGKSLLTDYESARDAFIEFREKFGAIEFNSRDYYVDGPESWEEATDARIEINEMLRDIHRYLERHLIHIHDQIK